MRRMGYLLAAILLLCVCVFSVSAATDISGVSSHTTVSRDGKCQVTILATIHVDEVRSDLEFPVPADATAVKLNGTSVVTRRSGDVRIIDLDKELGKMTGSFALSVNYELPDAIYTTEAGTLELRIPLLSGFPYVIEGMEFAVTLPGVIDTLPAFDSGYHQANIERDIDYTVDGTVIRGTFTQALKDHETVTMKLVVSGDMFPRTLADTQDYTFGLIGMAICGGLALLYWVLCMRFWPLRREHCTAPLEGYTAGEMGSVLGNRGTDLHLTVFSWAKMGYVTLHMDRKQKVTIHKRMDMGNERKAAEQKLFKKLFSKGDAVNTQSAFYANLAYQAEGKPLTMGELFRKRSGNPKVFRALAAGIGLFGGVCIAIAMSGGAFLQILLILVLGALGALFGWHIQSLGSSTLSPDIHKLKVYGTLSGLWLLLSLTCGAFSVAFWMIIGLLIAGVFLAWSGMRTDLGKQNAACVMGLRKHLRKVDPQMLQKVQEQDGTFFFSLVPYAMALGVGMTFAKRFGKQKPETCPYLLTGNEVSMTAKEWMVRLHRVYVAMGARARRIPMERMLALIRGFRR